ncbi:helix-turn-helix transcriptional regulator [Hymenobacter sp. BT186]|uniref:Helix-turn-helix transcriptional regulator n=1 Tax=Hymenobacter telluris TaxID=2816474 RepID=A0A939EXF4_9BACT|nr:AraC family transcriptional regulator [Hymenobacter telluris]MBO0359208.1 helix-turn-helix transcriptional regulator [Hymenobacter telluris]MBW3375234.1 AraC family transcriptional regulator [Hymenobacter norwichensis]
MSEKSIPLHSLHVGVAGVAVFPIAQADLTPDIRREIVVPHRHDHYSCFFTRQGTLHITIDFQPVQLTAGSLLVSWPGQIHQVAPPYHFQGWILVADAKLISPQARSFLEQAFTSPALLQFTPAENDWFQHLFLALHAATTSQSSLFHTEAGHALLNACMAQAVKLLDAQQQQQQQAHSRRSLALTRQFRHLLQQDFLTSKKPAAYAEKLHVTVSHLNDTVKAMTGFSVSYFIQQEVLAEAQRLLFYTDLNVQEIADQLGYEDVKYFSRLFAKGVGVAPSLFRKQSQSTQPG